MENESISGFLFCANKMHSLIRQKQVKKAPVKAHGFIKGKNSAIAEKPKYARILIRRRNSR